MSQGSQGRVLPIDIIVQKAYPVMSMDNVRFGVVGLGNMGLYHVETFASLKGGTLEAICDAAPANLERAGQKTPARRFAQYQEMLDSGLIDAVLIATPHFLHPEIALAAFERNIHVLCEKPLAVTVGQGRSVIEAAGRKPGLKFGLMFQMRTTSLYRKIRELISDGELGEISRITWIVTDWFRTWTYFASGGWRATWAGEGGGVLINQCPHNLDLIQWLTGLTPSRITAVGFVGKTHPIEVEDEVSAILEYPGGAIGHFITSTGEAPGTNRLEICGDRGKIVAERGKIAFSRTVQERSGNSRNQQGGLRGRGGVGHRRAGRAFRCRRAQGDDAELCQCGVERRTADRAGD